MISFLFIEYYVWQIALVSMCKLSGGSQNGSIGDASCDGRSTPGSTSNMGSGGSSGGSNNNDGSPGKLFVGGLSWQTTPDKLREYFGQFGTVTDVLVMKDPVTQVSKQINLHCYPHLDLYAIKF